MRMRGPVWRAAALACVGAAACGLSGCGPTTTADTQAAPTPTRAPTAVSATGTWVFKNSYTIETLRLRQRAHGIVSGDGSSAVTVKGKVDHSSIKVHSGQAGHGRLTLTLYISPIDWGTGLHAVEDLRCAITPRFLHCRMDLPLYTNVRNIKQDFARRV